MRADLSGFAAASSCTPLGAALPVNFCAIFDGLSPETTLYVFASGAVDGGAPGGATGGVVTIGGGGGSGDQGTGERWCPAPSLWSASAWGRRGLRSVHGAEPPLYGAPLPCWGSPRSRPPQRVDRGPPDRSLSRGPASSSRRRRAACWRREGSSRGPGS